MIISADELRKHCVVNALDTRLISGSFECDIGVIPLFSNVPIP